MSRLPLLTLAGLTLLLAAGAAPADELPVAAPAEAPAIDRTAPNRPEPAPAVDASWRDPAPAAPSRPAKRWSTSAELDSNSYRVSLSRGKLDLGMGFDAASGPATRTARSVDPVGPIVPTLPSLSIGLRSATPGPPPNSLIERAADGAPPSSTRRVGLEWKPVQSRVFVRGGLGVRLVGDDQVTMKLRAGQIGLYMKSSF
jgi:hypothetical protein